MCYCTVELSVCEYKPYPTRNDDNETRINVVSEQYCCHTLTGSATTGFGEKPPFGKMHPLQHS